MKNTIKSFVLLASLITLLVACEKEENRIFFNGGTAPILSASQTGTLPMSFVNAAQPAVALSWTNPNYSFTTGLSSHDVAYTIEIDKASANFGSANKKVLVIAKELGYMITQSELNDIILNQLQLPVAVPHSLQMRVIAAISGAASSALTSNVLTFTATPYAIPPKVAPPASGKLFMVGSATVGDWGNPVPANQEFTRVSPMIFELTTTIRPGGSYLFLPVNGSWDAKYGFIGANNTNNVDGDDFKEGGGDMLAPGAAGTYKISVDFQRGKWSITKL